MIKNCLAAFMLLAAIASAEAASFSMKRGVNLDLWTTWPGEEVWDDAAAVLPFPEWRKSLAATDFEALREIGFDFVRMPVDPAPFLSMKTIAFREQLFASVLESVRLVNEAGLKVVVDLHLIPSEVRSVDMGNVMADPARFDAYVEFVRRMARSLSGLDPTLVALEPMNEPVIDCEGGKTALWPERLQRLFAAARSSATKLTLVLGGACYSSAEALARLDPAKIADDNIIWTFHSYAPFLLTHQGATWAGDFIPYVSGLPYPPHTVPRAELDAALETVRARIKAEAPWARRSAMLAYLDEQIAMLDTAQKLKTVMDGPFELVAEWAGRHGIEPQNILLGEFGMIRQEYGSPHVMPGKYRVAYVRDMISRAEDHGFAWSIWSYGGAFGIVEEFDGRPAELGVMEAVRELP